MSVPNQKTLCIHKEVSPPFLSINESELYDAIRILSQSGLILFLYLANNQNGYRLELSKTEVVDKLKLLSRASYYRAVENLETFGYIEGNDFYTTSANHRQKLAQLKKEIKDITGQS